MAVDILKVVEELPEPLQDIHKLVRTLAGQELKVSTIDSSLYLLIIFLLEDDNSQVRLLHDLGLNTQLIVNVIKQDFPESANEDTERFALDYTPAAYRMFEHLGSSRIGRGAVRPPVSIHDLLGAIALSGSETVATIFRGARLSMSEVRIKLQVPTSQDLNQRV